MGRDDPLHYAASSCSVPCHVCSAGQRAGDCPLARSDWVLLYRRFNGEQLRVERAGLLVLNSFLILGLILSPTKVLGKGNDFFDCGGTDVLASYREAGADLRKVIAPGSKVYWEGRIDRHLPVFA